MHPLLRPPIRHDTRQPTTSAAPPLQRQVIEPAALQAPGPLHYAASPLQRQSAGGISQAENAAVAQLSGGRVDLHALGASVQRVPASDPRLQAVGARSYAQGRQALVSSEADRGHEIWHLAQQAMGRVQADSSVGGQPLNSQPALEREADRMGAHIERQAGPTSAVTLDTAGLASSGPTGAGPASGPVQRRVPAFEATYEDKPPPTTDLKATIDYSYFKQSKKQVLEAIDDTLVQTKASDTARPSRIEAEIGKDGKGDSSPKRQTHKSGMIGKFGINEFMLRSGGNYEVFEGGHLIPHELWSDQDPDVALADDYVNLVPMSRTMNVGNVEAAQNWRNIETKLVEMAAGLKGTKTFSVGIDIDHQAYSLSYSSMASIFNLALKTSVDGDETIDMYNWLPPKLSASLITNPKKPTPLGFAMENEIHDTFSPINSSAKLIAALKLTPLWYRMSDTLRDDIENL